MISVCIPTFNGEQFIYEQISSILSQLGTEDEIIISDDGSTDKTLEILKSFKDPRIQIVKNERSSRVSTKFKFSFTTRNIEFALKAARGDKIFLADQDDIWEKDRVSEVSVLLDTYMLVMNDCKVVDKEKNILMPSYFSFMKSGKGFFKNIYKNSYLGCCMAFKKELLAEALPFPALPVGHDIWLGLMAEKMGTVYFYNKPLVFYRRHENNFSPASGKSNNSFFFRIQYRLLLLLAMAEKSFFRH